MTVTAPHRETEPENLTGRMASGRARGRGWLATIIMIAFFVYFMIPLAWLVIASTKNNGDLFSTFGFWFSSHFNLFTNIHAVFAYSNGVFLRWMLNSLIYAVVSAAGASFLATAAGYGFAKYQFPAKGLVLGVVLGAIAVPTTALAIPTYLLFSKIGIVNTPWAIILPSMVNPIGVFLMRVYAGDAIPDSLIESGRLDGASDIGIFFRIGLRMLVPGLITVFLFSLVSTWNNYFLPLVMLNNPKLYPITVGLAQLNATANAGGGSQALFSVVVTGSLLSIIPLIVAFLLLQRFWQSGLSAGAVK
ncbi:MAG TPA: carbohydrate ABC transporter permease [Trebonia sp.]|jgi:multiple sugar transport system permease protein|nr:carbohydrate ABC transporter permease [Trebonia sp.]